MYFIDEFSLHVMIIESTFGLDEGIEMNKKIRWSELDKFSLFLFFLNFFLDFLSTLFRFISVFDLN